MKIQLSVLVLILFPGSLLAFYPGYSLFGKKRYNCRNFFWKRFLRKIDRDKIDVNQLDSDGMPDIAIKIFYKCARAQCPRVHDHLKSLLQRGLDPTIKHINGFSLLHAATGLANGSLAYVLLTAHEYTNRNDGERIRYDVVRQITKSATTYAAGRSPLDIACGGGPDIAADMVEMFYEFGKSVTPNMLNHKSQRGYTPLHRAIMNNNARLAYFLLDNGADPTIEDDQGKTPLDLAIADPEIDNMLISMMKDRTTKHTVS